MNVAWAGSGSNTFDLQWTDLEKIGVYPDAAFVPVWTPNNTTGPLTDAAINDMRAWAIRNIRAVQSYGITVIPWTGIPTNPSVHDYGATDAKRRAFNDEWRALAGAGVTIADMAAVMTGVRDADGQDLIHAGASDDDIHPNSAGKDRMKGPAKAAFAMAGVYRPGGLAT